MEKIIVNPTQDGGFRASAENGSKAYGPSIAWAIYTLVKQNPSLGINIEEMPESVENEEG